MLCPLEIKRKYVTPTLFPQCHGFHRFFAILAVFISIGPYEKWLEEIYVRTGK